MSFQTEIIILIVGLLVLTLLAYFYKSFRPMDIIKITTTWHDKDGKLINKTVKHRRKIIVWLTLKVWYRIFGWF